jgi:hypothetical protein
MDLIGLKWINIYLKIIFDPFLRLVCKLRPKRVHEIGSWWEQAVGMMASTASMIRCNAESEIFTNKNN